MQIKNFDYDYAMAAQWWGYNSLADFQREDPDVQAHNVAVFRTQRQLDAVVAYERHRQAMRNNKKHGRSAGRNKASS